MVSVTLVLIVGLTSLGAYLVATRRGRLRRADLHGAVMETLECLGLVVIFFLANPATLRSSFAHPRWMRDTERSNTRRGAGR